MVEKVLDRGAQLVRAGRRHQQSGAPGNHDLGYSVDCRRHHWYAALHRLDHRAGDALVQARHGKDVQRRQEVGDIAPLADQMEPVAGARRGDLASHLRMHRSAPDPYEMRVRGELSERSQHVGRSLLEVEAADCPDHSCRRRQLQLSTRLEAGGRRGLRHMIDRAADGTDALRRRDAQPNCVGRDGRTDGQEPIGDAPQGSFDRDVRRSPGA